MFSLYNRLLSSFCLGILLLSLTVANSCKTNPPDPKEELVRSLKGANVNGFLFAMKEDDNQVTTSLTNGALREPVKFDSSNRLFLGYGSVREKKANATKTLKAEIVKTDKTFKLLVTDIVADRVEMDEPFVPNVCTGEPIFNSSDECSENFNCRERPALLREANRTCKVQLFHLLCCLKNGNITDAFGFIKPTALNCLITFPFDIDTVVLSP